MVILMMKHEFVFHDSQTLSIDTILYIKHNEVCCCHKETWKISEDRNVTGFRGFAC